MRSSSSPFRSASRTWRESHPPTRVFWCASSSVSESAFRRLRPRELDRRTVRLALTFGLAVCPAQSRLHLRPDQRVLLLTARTDHRLLSLPRSGKDPTGWDYLTVKESLIFVAGHAEPRRNSLCGPRSISDGEAVTRDQPSHRGEHRYPDLRLLPASAAHYRAEPRKRPLNGDLAVR